MEFVLPPLDTDRRLLLLGAGEHARVVLEALRTQGRYVVHGLLDDDPALHHKLVGTQPVLGGFGLVQAIRAEGIGLVHIAFWGGLKGVTHRQKLAAQLIELGYALPAVVHGSAVVAETARLADGVAILAGAVVNPGAQVGRLAIVNTRAVVEHDCRIGEGVHLAPGCVLGGGVRVEAGTLVGLNATVLPRVRIGRNARIGAGAVVTTDVPDATTVVGVPARPVG